MLNLIELQEGQRVRMRSGAIGEVIENIGDGIWVQLRFVGGSDSAAVEEEELVHCEDIVGLADDDGLV